MACLGDLNKQAPNGSDNDDADENERDVLRPEAHVHVNIHKLRCNLEDMVGNIK